MKTIWKFPLTIIDAQHLYMPVNAVIRSIQMQASHPCIWAEVDTDSGNMEHRYIHMYGTGHEMIRQMGRDEVYIGTIQPTDGLVFHVYEVKS